MAEYKEYLYTTDVFKRPKVLEDREAISVLLVRLILLEPGTNPNRPDMGVGLVSRFRYMDEDNMDNLADTIQNQVQEYLPQFQKVDVKVSSNLDSTLYIDIDVDESLYRFEAKTDENNNIILSDLIS